MIGFAHNIVFNIMCSSLKKADIMAKKFSSKRKSRGLRLSENQVVSMLNSKSKNVANKAPLPLERDIQKTIIDWSTNIPYKGRKLSYYLHHSPNGGYRDEREGKNFKEMGVQSGYPDLLMDIARNGYHGLRIELKRSPKEELTPKQEERLEVLREEGFYAVVCTGVDDAIEVIKNYMGMK